MTNKKSVLHVDDDIKCQEDVASCLQGHAIIQTTNLEDAERLVRRGFDIYIAGGEFPLTPTGLPVRDAGLQLYKKIRQLHKGSLNYIILAGDNALERQCAELGISFFHKFDMTSFRAYLQTL